MGISSSSFFPPRDTPAVPGSQCHANRVKRGVEHWGLLFLFFFGFGIQPKPKKKEKRQNHYATQKISIRRLKKKSPDRQVQADRQWRWRSGGTSSAHQRDRDLNAVPGTMRHDRRVRGSFFPAYSQEKKELWPLRPVPAIVLLFPASKQEKKEPRTSLSWRIVPGTAFRSRSRW